MPLVPLMDTPERKAFWEFVSKVAEEVRKEGRSWQSQSAVSDDQVSVQGEEQVTSLEKEC